MSAAGSATESAVASTSIDHPTNSTTTGDAFSIAFPTTEGLRYVQYDVQHEHLYLRPIRALISRDLSEPYSIYVYRYFLNQWPDLCFMALDATTSLLLGVIVCKLEPHRSGTYRGYIAMLATQSGHRNRGIGSALVRLAIAHMRARGADEVVLETEVTNAASLRLYERLGFLRSKRLHRYYLNGNTAFRLALYLREGAGTRVPPDAGAGWGPAEPQFVGEGEDDDGPGGPGVVPQRPPAAMQPAGVV